MGEEILNQAIQRGKAVVNQYAKKIAGMLLKNPYFYLVVAIIFLIIIVAGMYIDVNSGTDSVTNSGGYTNVGESDYTGGELVEIAQGLHDYIRENEYAYSCSENVNNGYTNSCICDSTSHFGKTNFEEFANIKCIDCSAYVSWVLNQYLGEEQFGTRRNSVWFGNEDNWLSGWEKIDINDIQAGDILWREGHVGIYIGDGKTVEAGCTNAIRSEYSFGSIQSVTSSYTFAIRVS